MNLKLENKENIVSIKSDISNLFVIMDRAEYVTKVNILVRIIAN